MGYIFQASDSMSATRVDKIYSMDQSELGNVWAGIETLTYSKEIVAAFNDYSF